MNVERSGLEKDLHLCMFSVCIISPSFILTVSRVYVGKKYFVFQTSKNGKYKMFCLVFLFLG